MRDPILAEAFERRGAVTRVAKALGITTAAVSTWKRVPKKRVDAVAAVLGLEAAQLRPDLYAGERSSEKAA